VLWAAAEVLVRRSDRCAQPGAATAGYILQISVTP